MRLHTYLTIALLASPAITRAESAQQLLSACRPIATGETFESGITFPRTFETGMCWGLFAMLQEMTRHLDEKRRPIYFICSPESSTRSQLVKIFVKYADSVPERLHEDGTALALQSLQRAFPCAGGTR